MPEDSGLMQSEILQERFIALWIELEKEFSDDNDVIFELLNEVVKSTAEEWNAVAEKTIRAIRKINRDRVIVIGGTDYNNPEGLDDLKTYDDENIVYTFHCYAPFEFTHQQGVLQPGPLFYNRKLAYPTNDIEKYRDYYRCFGIYDKYKDLKKMDIEFLKQYLTPVFRFIKNNPEKILWCGEFGTIRHCKIEYRENWMRDLITIFKENEIP